MRISGTIPPTGRPHGEFGLFNQLLDELTRRVRRSVSFGTAEASSLLKRRLPPIDGVMGESEAPPSMGSKGSMEAPLVEYRVSASRKMTHLGLPGGFRNDGSADADPGGRSGDAGVAETGVGDRRGRTTLRCLAQYGAAGARRRRWAAWVGIRRRTSSISSSTMFASGWQRRRRAGFRRR